MTLSKNITQFITAEPRIAELAKALDLRLLWRAKALWADDVQLTYEVRVDDGRKTLLDSVEKKAALAVHILQSIEKARREWPSLLERANRMIDRFDREVVQPFRLRARHFTELRDRSLDCCSVFGGGFALATRDFQVTLDLVGQRTLYGRGDTLPEAIADLRTKAAAEYGGTEAGVSVANLAIT